MSLKNRINFLLIENIQKMIQIISDQFHEIRVPEKK